jgi:hypothetical protein
MADDQKPTEIELASYIGGLAAELSLLARGRGLFLLAHLLAMAVSAAAEIKATKLPG